MTQELKQVSARYVGRRWYNEKLQQMFLNGETSVYFSGIKGVCIGDAYFIDQKPDGRYSAKLTPDQDHGMVVASVAQMIEWQVHDSMARDTAAQRKRAKAIDRHPALDNAVRAIEPLLAACPHYTEHQLAGLLVRRARDLQNKREKRT